MVKRLPWLALSLLAACAGDGVIGLDGGYAAWPDAGARDAGTSPAPNDAAAPALDAGGARGEYDPGDLAGAIDHCTNGIDDDGNGVSDCDDATCRPHVAACCVGAGDPACCTVPPPAPASLTSCTGPASECAATLEWGTPFGSPGPNVARQSADALDTLVPGGQGEDAGLLGREVIDVRASAVTIEASLAASSVPHEGDADALAVGLVDADDATLADVTPRVAFLVSGSRGELIFLVAGAVARRWPLEDDAFHTYSLTVRPGGAIELSRDSARLGTASLVIDRPLRPIVYGRTFNPSLDQPAPARLGSLAIGRGSCDVPSALSRSGVVLPAADLDAALDVRSPGFVRWTDEGTTIERMAVEIDHAIYLAAPSADGWELTTPIGTPALAAGDGADALRDPALVWDDGLELWVTVITGEASRVARVRAAPGTESFAWSDVETVLAADDTSFSDPAPFVRGGAHFVVARVRTEASDALALYGADASPLGELRAPSRGDLFAFDRDEVASPAVVTTGSVTRLFFAGRRGLRWSIGELVSPNGRIWYEPSEGPLVLGPSDEGFDALGVRDPSPVFDGDVVRLYYSGLDGTRSRVGLAMGQAPPDR